MAIGKTEKELEEFALKLAKRADLSLHAKETLTKEQQILAQDFITTNLQNDPQLTPQQIALVALLGVTQAQTTGGIRPELKVEWGNQLLIPLLAGFSSSSPLARSQQFQQEGVKPAGDREERVDQALNSLGIKRPELKPLLQQYVNSANNENEDTENKEKQSSNKNYPPRPKPPWVL